MATECAPIRAIRLETFVVFGLFHAAPVSFSGVFILSYPIIYSCIDITDPDSNKDLSHCVVVGSEGGNTTGSFVRTRTFYRAGKECSNVSRLFTVREDGFWSDLGPSPTQEGRLVLLNFPRVVITPFAEVHPLCLRRAVQPG
jgi:hypothetical protein